MEKFEIIKAKEDFARRLEAIKNATGEYCIFCDSDDYIDNNLLEVIENTINNNAGENTSSKNDDEKEQNNNELNNDNEQQENDINNEENTDNNENETQQQ